MSNIWINISLHQTSKWNCEFIYSYGSLFPRHCH